MGIYLNPGKEKFGRALRSQIYVDKTGLLAYTNSVLDSEQSYICVSRPRRFGKSMTAEMIAAYYDKSCESGDFFDSMNIAKTSGYKEHLNQYDVIHVDMNDFRHRFNSETGNTVSAMEAVELFHSEIISEMKELYPSAINEQMHGLPTVLANVNKVYGSSFIIIIDEWDTIFREDKNDTKAQEAYITLLRGLFKDAPSKKFLKLAYMTGILPIKKYGTESALNNFKEFTMLNPGRLTEYVGFTEKEVESLCSKYQMDFEEVKRWYDGYSFRKESHIYNPNSVVNAMLDEEYNNYWTNTETFESLKDYICMDFNGLKDDVLKMLSGNRVQIDVNSFENDMVNFKNRDDVLTVLVHLGYLAYDTDTAETYIPNNEVKAVFLTAIRNSSWDTVVNAITLSDKLLTATLQKQEKTVAEIIDQVHMENTSILQYNDENSLSCVITLAYYNAMNDYVMIRELPTGKGFADIVFLPKRHSDKPALVVELKFEQSAEGAITQIKEKKYANALKGYRGNVLLVGINYSKDTKEHTCRIEDLQY